jgi:hypothetical protein
LVSLVAIPWTLACCYVGLNKGWGDGDMTNARYFDLDVRDPGATEATRVHGWYDAVGVDHKVLQYG